MESEKKSLEEQRELARKYAEYLKANNLKPGDATFVEPEELGVKPEPVQEQINKNTKKKKTKAPKKVKPTPGWGLTAEKFFAAPVYLLDNVGEKMGTALADFGRNTLKETGKIFDSYKSSKKTIATAVLAVCVLSAVMLVVFDKFTVYEYAYNGKTLGYVANQEDVTNVLDVAGENLNEINTDSEQEIEFTANNNISFTRVVATGKDVDDIDTTVNKLAFMTDIEVEASGIYDGSNLVTIVKDQESAEKLLADVKTILGTPDEGMEAISVEFQKSLDIRPINVLLTSVQSNTAAQKQMSEGGEVKFYHLVETDESVASIARTFGVKPEKIYDENNKNVAKSVTSGDKVCIRKTVEPVSVELIETGKMKEIIPHETIRKDSKELYIGDEEVKVEGVDGVQIFEGTLTKVGGKVTKRDTASLEVLTKKVDEVILVGITERPKTAPTGEFHNPLEPGTYVVTSRPGQRWGRMHQGIDMGAHTGTHIFASDGGHVIRASYWGGYGNCVEIEHDNGWITRYGHMSYIEVHAGEDVYQGQYIGNVGSTGHSTGPHLHFETRHNGAFVDPDTMVKGGL